jgi:DNA-binding NtrC family response regulator
VDEQALRALVDYHWPGNIRQLESVVEKAVIMCDSDAVTFRDIESELVSPKRRSIFDVEIPEGGVSFEEIEKELLRKAMEKSGSVAAKAARLLGMSYKTFWYRWEKFGLEESSPVSDSSKPYHIDIPEGGIIFEDFEKELLKRAMEKGNNVIARAARLLGLSDKAFRLRWEKFGLDSSKKTNGLNDLKNVIPKKES